MGKTNVLIVEDDNIYSLTAQKQLEKLGYHVQAIALSGEEAIEKARSLAPDIVLMDIVLATDMDGIEAAERINAFSDAPIVYVTSATDQETLQRATETGPFGFLIKPFEQRELRSVLEMALFRYKMEQKLQSSKRWQETTLSSISDAVVTTDSEGRIQLFNPMAEHLTGWKAQEVLGKRFFETIRVSDAAGNGGIMDMVTQVLRQETNLRLPEAMRLYNRDGVSSPVEVSLASIRSTNRHVQGLVLVFRDLTGQLAAEKNLRRTLENLQRTLGETVAALALTAEKRDPYTAGHQQRVAKISAAIGARLGYSSERIEGLHVAALLHDLGKIYIPAEILAKPARLSDMEMNLMKTHSEAGHEILKSVTFPWPVADIVLQHHERIDGTGYPHGLRGAEILPEAQIIMVADVVEAMSSHRPYRAALGWDKAMAEVKRGRGLQYHERIVDACLDIFEHEGFDLDG